MRILLINTYNRFGGAAIATTRLAEALTNCGLKVKLLVGKKNDDKITIVELDRSWFQVWDFIWERIVILFAKCFNKKNLYAVDIANTGTDITSLPEFQQADVIHFHWINHGMLSLKNVRKIIDSGKPIVWTMHDMWAYTGICHYAGECTKFQQECFNCPFLECKRKNDLSRSVFRKKAKLYKDSSIVFVGCSQWVTDMAATSALTCDKQLVHIPNTINTDLFKPTAKKDARVKCRLPEDKKLILFSAVKISDERKGFDYLVKACKLLATSHPELTRTTEIVVVGKKSAQLDEIFAPFKVHSTGFIEKESDLALVYNAVDLYVTPSLEDNLPNTIMEAMACGIPCVGFNVGGIPEMIDHIHNGYVAEYKSVEDLAEGIRWVLTQSDYEALAEQAHRKVLNSYSESTIARRYLEVYNKVTKKHA